MSRDKLIALLWPEADTERGRHLLSNSVYVLRRGLGGDVILSQGDALHLNPACIESDVGAFLDALDRDDCAAAVAQCGAPFLDGFFLSDAEEFERWAEGERDRLARACATALERLAETAEAGRDPRAAVAWWQRLAEAEPYSSRAVLRLMHALADAGDTGEAVLQARLHEKRLREDLDIELPDEIASLIDQLSHPACRGVLAVPEAAPTEAPATRAVPPQTAAAQLTDPESPQAIPARSGVTGTSATALRGLRRHPGRALGLVLPVLVVAAVLLRERVMHAIVGADGVVEAPSIAILPFVNLTRTVDDDYFSDGLTEELLNQLARVDGLRVAPRTSSFAFKGLHTDVREIGRRLDVALVLEGSVRRTGERLRVTAQLVSVADGYPVWSRTWEERELADIFEIQQEIAREIVANVDPALPGVAPVDHAGTTNPRAWDEYLRGRYAFWQGSGTAQLNDAIGHYDAALRHDPEYALAWAGLADAYMLLPGTPAERMQHAKAAARRALELDPDLAEGYVALASIAWFYDWDWVTAEHYYRRSFSANRIIYTRCICYVWYLAALGEIDGAIREARRARSLDPVALLPLTTLGRVYLAAGRTDSLRALLPALIAAGAPASTIDYFTAWLEWDAGQPERALAAVDRIVAGRDAATLATEDPRLLPALAYMYAGSGRHAEARALATALHAQTATRYVPPVQLASVFASAGDALEAARWIRAAYAERANLAYFAVTPDARPLRALPAYRAVLDSIGVPARP